MSESKRPIGMPEMNLIFEVTDALGISREEIEVPLMPNGEGAVIKLANGKFEITIPAGRPLSSWLPTLRRKLLSFDPS